MSVGCHAADGCSDVPTSLVKAWGSSSSSSSNSRQARCECALNCRPSELLRVPDCNSPYKKSPTRVDCGALHCWSHRKRLRPRLDPTATPCWASDVSLLPRKDPRPRRFRVLVSSLGFRVLDLITWFWDCCFGVCWVSSNSVVQRCVLKVFGIGGLPNGGKA